jgi:hypothetical protein
MPANSFTPLTPLSFLERAADVFADKTAIAYGERRVSYSEFGAEATRLAHALRASGVEPGDRVAYMCPNIPELLADSSTSPRASSGHWSNWAGHTTFAGPPPPGSPDSRPPRPGEPVRSPDPSPGRRPPGTGRGAQGRC